MISIPKNFIQNIQTIVEDINHDTKNSLGKILYPLSKYKIVIPDGTKIGSIIDILHNLNNSTTINYLTNIYSRLECDKKFKDNNPWEEEAEKFHSETIRNRYNDNRDNIYKMISEELGIFLNEEKKLEQIRIIKEEIKEKEIINRLVLSEEIEGGLTQDHIIQSTEITELKKLLNYIKKTLFLDNILRKKVDDIIIGYLTNDGSWQNMYPLPILQNKYKEDIILPLLEELLTIQYGEFYAIQDKKTNKNIIEVLQKSKYP